VRTYLGVSVRIWALWALASLALGLGLTQSGLLGVQQRLWTHSGCELLYVEPSGPEPSVTVWHSHWDCGTYLLTQEYVPAPESQWECGAVWEEGQWLEASCDSEEELAGRLAQIRKERSGGRVWGE
jgi:hypothetical protein